MNYEAIYSRLIRKAQSESRPFPNTYYERHHIVPRSLGGGDNPENLVLLSAREHFVAHLLLCKIHTGKNRTKMVYAAVRLMTRPGQVKVKDLQINRNSRTYQFLREQLSEIRKGKTFEELYGPEKAAQLKERASEARSGKTFEELYGPEKAAEIRDNMGRTTIGRTYEEIHGPKKAKEIKEKRKQAKIGKKLSEATRKKISEKAIGRPGSTLGIKWSEEAKARMSESAKRRNPETRATKKYRLVDPDGKEYLVNTGIRHFWRNLFGDTLPRAFHSISTFKECTRGKWKGWKAYVLS